MTDDILKNKVLIFIGAIIVLDIVTILILIYKKFAINVLQQNYPPPPKEEKSQSFYQFIVKIYNIVIKIPIDITIKFVIPSAFLLTVLECFGVDTGIFDLINKCFCGSTKKERIVCAKQDDSNRPVPPVDPHKNHFYDTDPQNDAYIKDSLSMNQLVILDQILEYEKEKCGLRLTWFSLRRLTGGDQKLTDAYIRWRKCKNLMRSSGRVIYPSERALYHY